MTIRPYRPSDYDSIKTILIENSMFDVIWDAKENLDSMIKRDGQSILVATENDIIIGLIIRISYGKLTQYIFRFALHPEYQHQNIGAALLQKAEEIAFNQGAKEVGLYVSATNEKLISYYTNKGYTHSDKPWLYMYKEKH